MSACYNTLMNTKKFALVLLIIAILAFAGFAVWYFAIRQDGSTTVVTETITVPDTDTMSANEMAVTEEEAVYTFAQVAEHSTGDDCWTVISGNVYNITSYVPMHPGGDEILEACGTDATTLFTERMNSMGESIGSGTPHSRAAQQMLNRYYIGTVSE